MMRRGSPPPIPERTLWINGRLARGEEANLSLFDRGARDGGGLFETLRIYDGKPHAWTRHMERLVLSAAVLGFPVPASPRVLREGLEALLAADGLRDAVARFTVTRGIPSGRPSRTGAWIEAEPVADRLWPGTRAGGASVIVSKRPFAPGPLGPHKTTSRLAYHLAHDEGRASAADEVLLVGGDGVVFEGSASNVFAVLGGEVVTPPLALGILPGVTRAIVLGLARELGHPVRERTVTRAELAAADEVFVTNSVQEVVPVTKLEGRPVPRREIGLRLRDAYARGVAGELE